MWAMNPFKVGHGLVLPILVGSKTGLIPKALEGYPNGLQTHLESTGLMQPRRGLWAFPKKPCSASQSTMENKMNHSTVRFRSHCPMEILHLIFSINKEAREEHRGTM